MNIEKGYLAISIGEENKMFTLRSHSTHIDGWGNAVESSYHVTNLSTDPEQARNKARAIAKKREMPLNNTSWVSNSSLDTIDRKSKEELDAIKADKERRIARAKEISAKIEINYHTLSCGVTTWLTHAESLMTLQKVADVAELDTEKRITLSGELVHIKEYMTEWGYVQKGIFLLSTGQKVYGSIPSLKDETINIGDVVQFDAKVEKPKDFDNTFYFFKRPTKARLLSQNQEVA
jgi:hypothetical protein